MRKKCEGKSKTFQRNLVLASVSVALAALTFGWDNLNGKTATAEDLAPPPLLWEAQPEPRKPDNTYYHKKKADQQQTQRRRAEEPTSPGPQQVQGGREPASSLPPSQSYSDEGISVEEYQRNLDAREQPDSDMIGDGDTGAPGVSEGYAGDDAVDDSGAMDKRAPAPSMPKESCNYNHFVGKNIKDVDFSLFGKRPTRVIYPNQAVTMDYSSSRINFEVEQSGKITRVACY